MPRQLRYLDFHANEGITGELYKLQNLKLLGLSLRLSTTSIVI